MRVRPSRGLLLALGVAGLSCSDRAPERLTVSALTAPSGNPAEGDLSMAVGDVGNGVQTFHPTFVKAALTPAERAELAAAKPAIDVNQQTLAAAPALTPTDETLQWAAAQGANTIVTFTLVLPERPFSWQDFQGAAGDARAAVVDRRKADLAEVQAPLVERLKALGAQDVGTRWLANAIDVTLPAGLAPKLAVWPEVQLLEHGTDGTPLGAPNEGYWGIDRRQTFHAERLLQNGYTGATGNGASPSTPVRLGAVMSTPIPPSHPGFLYPSTLGGGTRFYQYQQCSPTISPPSCSAGSNPTGQDHDTAVMTVMGGSIEHGQDPNFTGTNTTAQRDRSGAAPGSQLEYYQTGAGSGSLPFALAMQAAVGSGVDILNNSYGWADPGPTTDYNGINEQIQNAFNAGILMTVSGGNSNNVPGSFSTTCNQNYPSQRPEVLAVTGIATQYDSSGNLQTNPTMLNGAWATSGCTINVFNGSSYPAQQNKSIGVLGPGQTNKDYYWNSSSDYGYLTGSNNNWGGSSFAAPFVAGAAGLLRDVWQQAGYGIRPPYWLKTDLMMLTDGYSFTSYTDGGTNRLISGTSIYSGTGRLQMRAPISSSFPSGSWQWSWSVYSLSNSASTATFTVPANVQNFRLAMFWTETDLTHAADIDVSVHALDSNGVVCSSLTAQTDYSLINVIHIKRSDIPACALPNGSLQIQYGVYAMPSGQSRTVWSSYLWDNESGY